MYKIAYCDPERGFRDLDKLFSFEDMVEEVEKLFESFKSVEITKVEK